MPACLPPPGLFLHQVYPDRAQYHRFRLKVKSVQAQIPATASFHNVKTNQQNWLQKLQKPIIKKKSELLADKLKFSLVKSKAAPLLSTFPSFTWSSAKRAPSPCSEIPGEQQPRVTTPWAIWHLSSFAS